MAIQVDVGPVAAQRRARVGVTGRDLDIPKVNASVKHRGDEGVAEHARVDLRPQASGPGQMPLPPGRRMTVHPGAAAVENLGRTPIIALLNCRAGCLPGGMPWKQWPHESAFVTKYAAAVVPDAVCFNEVWVDAEQGTVLLIGSKAGKAEQCQSLVTGPLGGQEVAVVHAAMRTDQLHPPAGEAFEGVDLLGNDDVLHHASDHAPG